MQVFLRALFALLVTAVLIVLLYYGGTRIYQDLSQVDQQSQQTTSELNNRILELETEIVALELRTQQNVLFWFTLSLASSLVFALLLFLFKSNQIRRLEHRVIDLEKHLSPESVKNLPEHE